MIQRRKMFFTSHPTSPAHTVNGAATQAATYNALSSDPYLVPAALSERPIG